jgi:hypothetical protein
MRFCSSSWLTSPRRPAPSVDIAREAKVGAATLERVLNARGNVRPETVEKVVLAVRTLGYDRRLPARYHGTIRIEVIMVRPDTPFFKRLNQAFARIAASLDSSALIHRRLVKPKASTNPTEPIYGRRDRLIRSDQASPGPRPVIGRSCQEQAREKGASPHRTCGAGWAPPATDAGPWRHATAGADGHG